MLAIDFVADIFSQLDTEKHGQLRFEEISTKLSDLGFQDSVIHRVLAFLDCGECSTRAT